MTPPIRLEMTLEDIQCKDLDSSMMYNHIRVDDINLNGCNSKKGSPMDLKDFTVPGVH
jgi:hypothetical protein